MTDITLSAEAPQSLNVAIPWELERANANTRMADPDGYLRQLKPATKTVALPVGCVAVRIVEETGAGQLDVTVAGKPRPYKLGPRGDLLIETPGTLVTVSRPGETGLDANPPGAGYSRLPDNGYGQATAFSIAILPAGSEGSFPVLVR